MPPTNIASLLETHFALQANEVTRLPGEVDYNYRVRTAEATYLLKLSRPGTDPSALHFETAVMQHLAEKNLPVQTPVPLGRLQEIAPGQYARLQSWVPGRPLSELNPITPEVRQQWGATAAQLSVALADFTRPDAPSNYRWNPSQCLDARQLRAYLTEPQQKLADHFWAHFERTTLPHLRQLRQSINYNDAHGDNLLVDEDGNISGLIDFGDALHTHTLNELAIACAYAGMHLPDPLGAMREVVAAYHRSFPLLDEELPHLFSLITGRLLLTVTAAAEKAVLEPENAYLQVSATPAWALLEQLKNVPPALAEATFRAVSISAAPLVFSDPFPVVDLSDKVVHPMNLSVGSRELGHYRNYEDLAFFTRHVRRLLEDKGADFGVGGYGETRPIYTTDAYVQRGNDGPRWRSVHLGIDIWGPAGTPVYAPYDGVVHSVAIDPSPGSYGPTIILEHDGFYTLYGHLDEASVRDLAARTQVQKGDQIARFGAANENGGWPPHLHFQVIRDMLGYVGDFPGVAFPEEAEAWLALCPDPIDFFGRVRPSGPKKSLVGPEGLTRKRKNILGYGLSLSYTKPLHIVRGVRQYLLDASGRRYLDTVNNVAHVGHEHPAVVKAIRQQAAVLNTNSRYLHENILHFAEELSATLPPELSVVHFVNSGSEANELALRMCENWANTRNMLAVEVGYHGNTGRTIDISSYKFDGKGGQGAPPQTTIVPMPDLFRGRHRDTATGGTDYAEYVRQTIREAEKEGKQYGGFIAESILSCGGQIVLPEGYLRQVYAAVRAHGGLCIADEVQVGLGRVGSHWWGFELQGVVPDIVTIGKPIGNGHPLGAVDCTPAEAESFANGMEYFNTFGGNPVSAAVGRAVLKTVRSEGLKERALETGNYLKTLLHQLAGQYPLIGDVRGEGLFLGFELIGADFAPATAPAKHLKNRMRELGFLMSTDGPHENVLKLKPPLCFTKKNAEHLIEFLDQVLREDKI